MATTASSCNIASNIHLVIPTASVNGSSCDTLQAMVVSCSPSQLLQGSGSPMVTASIMGGAGRKRSAMEGGGGDQIDDHEEALGGAEDDDIIIEDDNYCNAYCTSSDYLYKPEKKRRLSPEQVRRLEKSFEVENKLEPERKLQLAKDLRLHPRQVAVWFQNRRARWKTKQLEKDYDALKLSHTTLQAQFDALLKEKQELHQEVISLKAELQQGDHASNIIEKERLKDEETSKENNGEKLLPVTVDVHQELHHVTDKQRDGEKLLLHVAEVSALSGTEESAVSEAVNSPHAIDSGVNSKEDIGGAENVIPAINVDQYTNNYISSCAAGAASAIKTTSGDQGSTVFPKILALEPIVHVKAEMEEDENYSKYCFILEDQGAFPWWNSTSWV